MNKTELVDGIAFRTEHPKKVVDEILAAAAEVITNHFAAADPYNDAEVVLPGLGKLKASTRAARTGRNPKTGEAVEIPERLAVKFAAGKALEDTLNP
ncbi:HU family DNA-binding protein [Aromatoleum toluclasticum]|uniref:HU family DNA-binding protein n=1 Tax=Aromatoleum toluclasticum TaxID=92003 RepID=UPI001D197FEC|nr:HU family DNA-binding protein [Aromatoleum toluclasticum]MCC4116375.1 HU family DNA-binding protein [Aromatoleum toluclasticum]